MRAQRGGAAAQMITTIGSINASSRKISRMQRQVAGLHGADRAARHSLKYSRHNRGVF
jgi:hypothetical protein